jgi:RNA polymerase sigma-70 factor (ECF subfamily)
MLMETALRRKEPIRLRWEWGLVLKARAGDGSAFEALYRANVNRVYGLVLSLTGDVGLAEELTQDVSVKAWEKLPSFRGQSAFSTWPYALATNATLSERRSRRRRTARIAAVEDLTGIAGGRATHPAARIDLETAIAQLPQGARSVFLLHDVEGLAHQEIAEITGIAPGTSKAQLHRARRLLREALA